MKSFGEYTRIVGQELYPSCIVDPQLYHELTIWKMNEVNYHMYKL